VLVDPREPVARPCRDDDHVASLDLVGDAVPDVRPVVARAVELDDRYASSPDAAPVR
jgi:hypothetical protein